MLELRLGWRVRRELALPLRSRKKTAEAIVVGRMALTAGLWELKGINGHLNTFHCA